MPIEEVDTPEPLKRKAPRRVEKDNDAQELADLKITLAVEPTDETSEEPQAKKKKTAAAEAETAAEKKPAAKKKPAAEKEPAAEELPAEDDDEIDPQEDSQVSLASIFVFCI